MGNERDHMALLDKLEKKEDWTAGQKATKVVMTPAACYPIYPTMAKRGPLPKDGRLVDVYSYCFRHEPSVDPARMQLFRMREYVRIGSPQQVMDFRQLWLERGQKLMESLKVPLKIDVANDPFFGRAGKMLAVNQRDQNLKFELLIPITSETSPTACLSFNYHQEHFGHLWHLQTHDGAVAHTACVGFGMERVTLALFKHHGFDVGAWPAAGARRALGFLRRPDATPAADRRRELSSHPLHAPSGAGPRRTATSISGSSCCTRSGTTRAPGSASPSARTSRATSSPSSSSRSKICRRCTG